MSRLRSRSPTPTDSDADAAIDATEPNGIDAAIDATEPNGIDATEDAAERDEDGDATDSGEAGDATAKAEHGAATEHARGHLSSPPCRSLSPSRSWISPSRRQRRQRRLQVLQAYEDVRIVHWRHKLRQWRENEDDHCKMCDKLVELDRYFAKWALEEEKMNLIQDFLPDGRYGKSNICRKSMAQIGEYGPYGDQGNAIYGACARAFWTRVAPLLANRIAAASWECIPVTASVISQRQRWNCGATSY